MVKPRPHTPGIAGSTDPAMALAQVRAQWGGKAPLWVFAYASLLWRPEFDVAEQSLARGQGWHRALQMWSRVNRGTPAQPGLVFALLRGGSCSSYAPECQLPKFSGRCFGRMLLDGTSVSRQVNAASLSPKVSYTTSSAAEQA